MSRRPEDFADTLALADVTLRLFPNPVPVNSVRHIHMHRSLALLNLGRMEESVAAYALGMLKPYDPKTPAGSASLVEAYAKLAVGYDDNALHQSFSQRMAAFIAETIGTTAGKRVLDAGCGTGLLGTHIKAAHFVGLDQSSAMLAKARAQCLRGTC